MTTHNKPSSDDAIVALCNDRIAGLTQFTKGVTSLSAKGTQYKPAALIAIYQKCLDTRTARGTAGKKQKAKITGAAEATPAPAAPATTTAK